jgi:tRNA-specific 2-thiouridylase
MKATVAVSGGTDSLFALLSLRDQGYNVTALHARFLPAPPDGSPVPALEDLCKTLGVPLVVAELSEKFQKQVMDPFAIDHTLARTPNPCALCNRYMKFGELLDVALRYGDVFATGHYACMMEHPIYGNILRTGHDSTKDQSYFLALVPIERLRLCTFPLAEKKKSDIRQWLTQHGYVPPLPSESQEICFIPNDDHYAWLEQRQQEGLSLPGPGPVILAGTNRIIATHRGLWQYTEGQRRGLRIAWSEPLYVLKRLKESNTLVVGPKDMLLSSDCTVRNLNIMVPVHLWPEKLFVRVRYHQFPVPSHITLSNDRMNIHFSTPQQPPAPGQIAAVYDAEGCVLAGGILE